MKAALRFLSPTFWGLLLFVLVQPGMGAEQQDLLEEVLPYGYINWSTGTVFAEGSGVSAGRPEEDSENTPPTSQAAQNTINRLFQVVQQVRINSSTLVSDLVKNNDMIGNQLKSMVRLARPVKREYVSIGTVETTFAIDLTSGLAQLALPKEIKPVPDIKRIPADKKGEMESRQLTSPAPFSGFIFDARGLDGVPAMAPRVMNENGEEIYGSAYVSREFAVHHGMATFMKDLDAGKNNPRVAGNPLTIKCLKAEGNMPCDFVISNADASRIRSASENLTLLKQCKVIIILD